MSFSHETCEETSVLVVGGSLVGLSAAVCLAHHGVPTIVLERHASSGLHPRAIGVSPRSMEIYRSVGLDSQIPQLPPEFRLRRARVESLAGRWFNELPWTDCKGSSCLRPYSPCSGSAMSQDQLEPVLRMRAIELGTDVRMKNHLVRFQQDDKGVMAVAKDRTGREYRLRAEYMIAADGHRSSVREELAIPRSGRGVMQTVRSVVFRAPLETYLNRGITQFIVEEADFKCFLTVYRDGRWMLVAFDDIERDDNELRLLISRAIGRDNVPIEIITAGRWELSAQVADSFQSGRVFLAGDAAHTLPPNRGGYGVNTGIEDAHNLAWKLAHVLRGTASTNLLDTYDSERQPIAWLRHEQIFARADFEEHRKADKSDIDGMKVVLDDVAMEFGQRYNSCAIIDSINKCDSTSCDNGPLERPLAMRPECWAGLPGTRAPHLQIQLGETSISTLDLFGREWVLLFESEDWHRVLATVQNRTDWSLPVQTVQVNEDVFVNDIVRFRTAWGWSSTGHGTSLVRPDGYVAWRTQGLHRAEDALEAVLQQLMGLGRDCTKRVDIGMAES
ncbi:hypothetical protein AWENTII_005631 [Aspergillus wentii]|nr:hypothetical protein MW887_000456 [Aspergillus wentii]